MKSSAGKAIIEELCLFALDSCHFVELLTNGWDLRNTFPAFLSLPYVKPVLLKLAHSSNAGSLMELARSRDSHLKSVVIENTYIWHGLFEAGQIQEEQVVSEASSNHV